jgi:hypothetical protein
MHGRIALSSSRPSVAGILLHVSVIALLVDVLFFIVAVAFGGIGHHLRRTARAFVAAVVFRDGRDNFCHAVLLKEDNALRAQPFLILLFRSNVTCSGDTSRTEE